MPLHHGTADTECFFFLYCVQMSETPSHLYWLGGGIGAVSLASISATVMWLAEKKAPTVSRDLILGSILFFLLLQLLPESTMTLVTTILSVFKMNGGVLDAATAATAATAISSDDMEVRVGVPRF